MDESKIFDKAYSNLLSRVKLVNIARHLDVLGIKKRGAEFLFDFFNQQIVFDGNDFFDRAGEELAPAVKVVLCTYILMSPTKKIKSCGRLVTFREFSDAGPLFSRFTENTAKIVQTSFSGQLETLQSKSLKLGGTLLTNPSYDISVRFRALPRIPIILNFNDAEDIMPANAGFLYQEIAASFLDLQCLSITCTYLTGLLIQN